MMPPRLTVAPYLRDQSGEQRSRCSPDPDVVSASVAGGEWEPLRASPVAGCAEGT